MSRSKSIQSKYFKLVGVVAIAAVGVIGLIRCVPSDQAVVTDETVSEKVKEAEAAEEAEALAMKEAHGADSHHGKATKSAKADKPSKATKATKMAKIEKPAKHETKHEAAHEAAHAPAHQVERQPASVAATTHGAGSLYIVQVGAFKVKENAEKLTAKLKDAGFPVRLQSMMHSKSGELHLVRFEPTPNKAEAQDAIAKLEAKESMKASLLSVPAGS